MKHSLLSLLIFNLIFSLAQAGEFKCEHQNWDGFISKIRGLQRASSCTGSMSISNCKEYLGLGVAGLGLATGGAVAGKVAKRLRDRNFRVCSVQSMPKSFNEKISFAFQEFVTPAFANACFPKQQFLFSLLRNSQSEIEKLMQETAASQKQSLAAKLAELAEMQADPSKAAQMAENKVKEAKAKMSALEKAHYLYKQDSGYQSARHELESSRASASAAERSFSQQFRRATGIQLNQTGAVPVQRLSQEIEASNMDRSAKDALKRSLSGWLEQEQKSDRIMSRVSSLEESDQMRRMSGEYMAAKAEVDAAQKSLNEMALRQKTAKPVVPEKLKVISEEITKLKSLGIALEERSSAIKSLFEQVMQNPNLKPSEFAAIHESIRALVPEVQDHVNMSKVSNLRNFSSMLIQDGVVKSSITQLFAKADEAVIRMSATGPVLSKFFGRIPVTQVLSLGTKVTSLIRFATIGLAAAALAPAAMAQEAVLYMGNGGCQTLNSTTFPVSPETGCKANLSLSDPKVSSLINLTEEQLCEKLKADPNLIMPISTLYSQAYPPLRASCGPPFTMKSPSAKLFDGDITWIDGKIVIKKDSGKLSEESLAITMSGETESTYDISLRSLTRGRSGSGPSHQKKSGTWPPEDVDRRQIEWIQKYNAIKPALIEASACCSNEGASPSKEDCENYGLSNAPAVPVETRPGINR